MITCIVEVFTDYKKKMRFVNPKCGHLQEHEWATPFKCQHQGCDEENVKVDRLYGKDNQNVRVKFFVEGKI